jgi:hypothetical protein
MRHHIRPAGAPPPRPTSIGTAGRLQSEQVADINRDARPTSSEYARTIPACQSTPFDEEPRSFACTTSLRCAGYTCPRCGQPAFLSILRLSVSRESLLIVDPSDPPACRSRTREPTEKALCTAQWPSTTTPRHLSSGPTTPVRSSPLPTAGAELSH